MATVLDQITDLLALPKRGRQPIRVMSDVEPFVRKGLPSAALHHVHQACSITVADFAPVIGTSKRNVYDLLKRKNIDATIGDRLFRVAFVIAKATEIFESREKASRWMTTPLQALGGETPFNKLATEIGTARVHEVLGAIEHGVYA